MLPTRLVQASVLAMSVFSLWPRMDRRVLASGLPILIHVVDYPRPVAAAVLQVEKHFGWVVTYEDTSYVHPDDIVDITKRVRRDGDMSKRVLGMRGGTIDFTYVPQTDTVEAQVGEVMRTVVARSQAAGNTGEFRIDWVRGGYHVVPVAIKGKSGAAEPYASLLDTRITLPAQEEDGVQMMLRLAAAITRSTKRTVTAGTMPINALARARVSVVARNEIARDVLWDALQSISPRLSWQLLCDVGESGPCAINIHPVPKK